MTDSTAIRLPAGLFVTATGTGAGKTFITRGLASALRAAGHVVAALKPIETGVSQFNLGPQATDAARLAGACRPWLAATPDRPWLSLDGEQPGFYRAAMPAAPRAVSLSTEAPPPDLEELAQAIVEASRDATALLVEGAGGLLVPLDRERTIADLARRLGLPLLLVAPNTLGVLSHALTAFESAARRELEVAAIVLTELDAEGAASDPSRPHNAAILRERLRCPVLSFPFCPDASDEALAAAARQAQLLDLLPLR